jgi:hypothetical protein
MNSPDPPRPVLHAPDQDHICLKKLLLHLLPSVIQLVESARGRSEEGEFMNAILSRVFWAKTQVFCDSSVSRVFYLRFSLLQNAIHEETLVDLSLSVSRIFFVRIFKTRLEYGFLSGFFCFVSIIFIIFTCRCLL